MITHNNPKQILDFIIEISALYFQRSKATKFNWKLTGSTRLMYLIKQKLPLHKFSKRVYLEYKDKKAIIVARKIIFVKKNNKLDIYPSVH